MTEYGDSLIGASILLGMLSGLYALWYGRISEALVIPLPGASTGRPEDRIPELRQIQATMRRQATPLAAATVVVAAIFAPEVASIVVGAFDSFAAEGIAAVTGYDPIPAALIAVWLVTVAIAIHLTMAVLQLRGKAVSWHQ